MLSRTVRFTRILSPNILTHNRLTPFLNRSFSFLRSKQNVNPLQGQWIAGDRNNIRNYSSRENDGKDGENTNNNEGNETESVVVASSQTDDNHDDSEQKGNAKCEEKPDVEADEKDLDNPTPPPSTLFYPGIVKIPEEWPQAPVIALRSKPIFPGFVKTIEVTDTGLMEILRSKVKAGQPYVGLFLKRNEDCMKEAVSTKQELYNVGIFCQIVEFQDLGDKLQMKVWAHRRIQLLGHVAEVEAIAAINSPDEKDKRQGTHNNQRSKNGEGGKFTDESTTVSVKTPGEVESSADVPVVVEGGSNDTPSLVRFQVDAAKDVTISCLGDNNSENRALLEEIAVTFIELAKIYWPLYLARATAMLMHEKIAPADWGALVDLVAAITASENCELQSVLEEMNLTKRLKLILGLLKKEQEKRRERANQKATEEGLKSINNGV